MMSTRFAPFLALLSALSLGCGSGGPTGPPTGLSGVVFRGPIQPVCTAGDPCEEAFAAGFTVRRHGFVVRRFDSDAEGRFSVELAPGTYLVVPDPDAPILGPQGQAQEVRVEEPGFTEVELHFDTGIR
jgi:hypothetical protein